MIWMDALKKDLAAQGLTVIKTEEWLALQVELKKASRRAYRKGYREGYKKGLTDLI